MCKVAGESHAPMAYRADRRCSNSPAELPRVGSKPPPSRSPLRWTWSRLSQGTSGSLVNGGTESAAADLGEGVDLKSANIDTGGYRPLYLQPFVPTQPLQSVDNSCAVAFSSAASVV